MSSYVRQYPRKPAQLQSTHTTCACVRVCVHACLMRLFLESIFTKQSLASVPQRLFVTSQQMAPGSVYANTTAQKILIRCYEQYNVTATSASIDRCLWTASGTLYYVHRAVLLGAPYLVLHTWCSILGAPYLVLHTWCSILGAPYLVFHTQFNVCTIEPRFTVTLVTEPPHQYGHPGRIPNYFHKSNV